MRPNVLLVTIDQWRADCLSCAGHPLVETPNLDRFAATAVRFTSHYAQAAPCGPSRASLHTGLYAMTHRSVANGTPLDARFPTVATLARAAGYDPVLFGYTDTTIDPRTVPDDDPRLRTYEGLLPGFREGVMLPEHARPWLAWLRSHGHDVSDDVWELYAQARPGVAAPYPAEHSEAAFLTEAALAEIDRSASPWFVHVAFLRPHPPWLAPAPWHDRYDPADVPGFARNPSVEGEAATHPLLAAVLAIPGVRAPAEDEMRAIKATYYGMLSEVDAQVGALLDGLSARGYDSNTVVLITSDHGEQLGDHHLVEKLLFFDQSFRIPLLVRAPACAPGSVVDAFTENVDVLPTLVDLCELDPPPSLDGASLAPFVRGDDEPDGWRNDVHWEWDFRDPVHALPDRMLGLRMDECTLAVVRDRHTKYVHFGAHAHGMAPILFDLDDDPEELVNRAGDPAHAVRELDAAQRMLTWRLTHADATLTGHVATADGMVARRDPPRPGRPESL
jgi:arylsulfatase A-like enzyme